MTNRNASHSSPTMSTPIYQQCAAFINHGNSQARQSVRSHELRTKIKQDKKQPHNLYSYCTNNQNPREIHSSTPKRNRSTGSEPQLFAPKKTTKKKKKKKFRGGNKTNTDTVTTVLWLDLRTHHSYTRLKSNNKSTLSSDYIPQSNINNLPTNLPWSTTPLNTYIKPLVSAPWPASSSSF